jgi:hypothetical protein
MGLVRCFNRRRRAAVRLKDARDGEQAMATSRKSSEPFGSIRVFTLGLAIAVAVWLFLTGKNTVRFKEEILLPMGQVALFDRTVRVTPLGEIGGPGGSESKFNKFRWTNPLTGELVLEWESSDGLVPMLLDREGSMGDWILVATLYTCETWYDLGRPKLPYAQFRFREGTWTREPLSTRLIGRDANIYTEVPLGLSGPLLTLEEKRRLNAEAGIAPESLHIVDRWARGC